MPTIAVIVPCFNEAERLQIQEFVRFAHIFPEMNLLLVNDGSTDGTATLLENIKMSMQNRVQILTLLTNSGKGEAVRQGMIWAQKENFDYTGFLDADGATPVDEFYRICQIGMQQNASIIIGSRIKKIDSVIQRSAFRHFIGRSIATFLDIKFQMGYYDTQCGAKLFKTSVLKDVIQVPFYTRWFFDVELMLRIRKQNSAWKAIEVPLAIWLNKKGSKINLLSFPMVLKELFILTTKY